MLNRRQFKDAYDSLKMGSDEEGGFSVNVVTGESPTSGIMVSYPDTEHEMKPPGSPRELVSYARANKGSLYSDDTHLGGWKPPGAESSAWVDRSRKMSSSDDPVAHADNVTSAMDMATAYGQESVYDVKPGRVIPNPDWQHIKRR